MKRARKLEKQVKALISEQFRTGMTVDLSEASAQSVIAKLKELCSGHIDFATLKMPIYFVLVNRSGPAAFRIEGERVRCTVNPGRKSQNDGVVLIWDANDATTVLDLNDRHRSKR